MTAMLSEPSLKPQAGQRTSGYFAVMEALLILLLLTPVLVVLIHSLPVSERTRPSQLSRMETVATQSVQAGMTPVRTSQKHWIDSMGFDICFDVERSLHMLVPYTVTRCIPFHEGAGLSFIVTSAKPIFAIYGAKKAWLTGVVSVMGKALNAHQDLEVDHIWVSDGSLMGKRQGLALPGSIAKDLQRKANEISPNRVYLAMTDALRQRPIPPQ